MDTDEDVNPKGREKGARIFRYYPEDFGEVPVTILHMDLTFDVHDDHTRVTSFLTARTLDRSVQVLDLNAKDLEIVSVTSEGRRVTAEYRKAEAKLRLTFQPRFPPGTEFTIRTETVCRPTKNILEGLYYDETPPGAPPTQITASWRIPSASRARAGSEPGGTRSPSMKVFPSGYSHCRSKAA